MDSYVEPEPWAMPGYDSDVIMAAGALCRGLPLNYLQMVLLSHLILCISKEDLPGIMQSWEF